MGVVEGGCPALNGVVLIQDDTTPKLRTSACKIARAVPVRKYYFQGFSASEPPTSGQSGSRICTKGCGRFLLGFKGQPKSTLRGL